MPTLFEVHYQDAPNGPVESDVVFSQAEAEDAVIDFYNDLIQEKAINAGKISGIEDVAGFIERFPDLTVRCWHNKVDESDAKLADEPAQESLSSLEDEMLDLPPLTPFDDDLSAIDAEYSPLDDDEPSSFTLDNELHYAGDFEEPTLTKIQQSDFLESIVLPLQQGLADANLHISDIALLTLLSQAAQAANTLTLSLKSPAPRQEEAVSQVLLVDINEEDMAVYLNGNYIDASNKYHDKNHDDVISTANMFADKYRTPVEHHKFTSLPGNWSWTDVDKILKQSGAFHNRNICKILQSATCIKIDGLVTHDFEFINASYQAYATTGVTDLDILIANVEKNNHPYQIYLTIEELAGAKEIRLNHWQCEDMGGTEIEIDNLGYEDMEEEIDNLLR